VRDLAVPDVHLRSYFEYRDLGIKRARRANFESFRWVTLNGMPAGF
jgi:hypothetical protein